MKIYYKMMGLFSLGLGILGAFLPLLPTTCFVLFSAWCFAKSSPIWHQRLCESPLLGPIITQWEQTHCISRKGKIFALCSMFFFGALSFWMIDSTVLRVLLVVLLGIGVFSIYYVSRRCYVS